MGLGMTMSIRCCGVWEGIRLVVGLVGMRGLWVWLTRHFRGWIEGRGFFFLFLFLCFWVVPCLLSWSDALFEIFIIPLFSCCWLSLCFALCFGLFWIRFKSGWVGVCLGCWGLCFRESIFAVFLFCVLLMSVQVYHCVEVLVLLRYPLSIYEFRVGLSVIVPGADSV